MMREAARNAAHRFCRGRLDWGYGAEDECAAIIDEAIEAEIKRLRVELENERDAYRALEKLYINHRDENKRLREALRGLLDIFKDALAKRTYDDPQMILPGAIAYKNKLQAARDALRGEEVE